MPDTYTLGLKNFRSLEDVTLEVAPLTVIYGANGSGKSSLLYGLLTLRNFLTNPNQNTPSFFLYPSISLGGIHEVAHRHSSDQGVTLSIGVSNGEQLSTQFTLRLYETGALAALSFDNASIRKDARIIEWPNSLNLALAIPYQMNQAVEDKFTLAGRIPVPVNMQEPAPRPVPGILNWNGVTLAAYLTADLASYSHLLPSLNERANSPMELARQTGFVPLRRGFSRPVYSSSPVSPWLLGEDEVASMLASPSARFMQYEISGFLERIAGRRIQPQVQIGTSIFTIDSVPTSKGVPASIVNEGFGINQLVYMLTICLHSSYKIVAIEEPEIHLHPSMVRELAIALAEIAVEKERRLIVSTHSETFVVALLSQIAAGKIKTDDVSFVLAENPNGSTVLTQQKANRNGQIEGGLRAFMASEAKDLVDFLGLSSE